jgi:hypothetical protein
VSGPPVLITVSGDLASIVNAARLLKAPSRPWSKEIVELVYLTLAVPEKSELHFAERTLRVPKQLLFQTNAQLPAWIEV